jgi:hypothetical protein
VKIGLDASIVSTTLTRKLAWTKCEIAGIVKVAWTKYEIGLNRNTETISRPDQADF